ncbi:MAG: MOSC N-terminal beta barrel domain-containing protein [Ferruginibacter sp.]
MYILSQLFIYPVKSLAGFEVSSAPLCERGLHYDRRWMLIDAGNNFLTQRNYPVMSLLQTDIDNDKLVIYHKHDIADTISVDLDPAPAATFKVNIWNDECEAQGTSDVADKWFSDKLSVACRLVYMPETSRRKVDPVYARKNEITGFSDAYPLMMVGQASLDDLNSRLLVRVPMNRFRPNIVFTGGKAYDEDLMEQIVINGLIFME